MSAEGNFRERCHSAAGAQKSSLTDGAVSTKCSEPHGLKLGRAASWSAGYITQPRVSYSFSCRPNMVPNRVRHHSYPTQGPRSPMDGSQVHRMRMPSQPTIMEFATFLSPQDQSSNFWYPAVQQRLPIRSSEFSSRLTPPSPTSANLGKCGQLSSPIG